MKYPPLYTHIRYTRSQQQSVIIRVYIPWRVGVSVIYMGTF